MNPLFHSTRSVPPLSIFQTPVSAIGHKYDQLLLTDHPYWDITVFFGTSKKASVIDLLVPMRSSEAVIAPIKLKRQRLVDLRAIHGQLPVRTKIYAICRHASNPQILLCGTNVGIFCVRFPYQNGISTAILRSSPPLTSTHEGWLLSVRNGSLLTQKADFIHPDSPLSLSSPSILSSGVSPRAAPGS